MAENTKIEWCDHKFLPWRDRNGSRVVASEAQWRLPLKWNRKAERSINAWQNMLNQGHSHESLVKQGFIPPHRPMVCVSYPDVFEDWHESIGDGKGHELYRHPNAIVGDWISIKHSSLSLPRVPVTLNDVRERLFNLIDSTPHLDWLLLTKRPENIWRMWPLTKNGANQQVSGKGDNHRPNVWLGTSIGTQADADKNIPELLKCRGLSPVLFVSAEPLLEEIDISPWLPSPLLKHCPSCGGKFHAIGSNAGDVVFECSGCKMQGRESAASYFRNGLNWSICGGESGSNARPMHPDWARSLRDQCVAAGVPFLFKQWGEWTPGNAMPGGELTDVNRTKIESGFFTHAAAWHLGLNPSRQVMDRVGKKAAGRLLDGVEWNQLPEQKAE